MRKIRRMIISAVLAAAALTNCCAPVFAAQKKQLAADKIVLNETFEDYATGAAWSQVKITGGRSRIIDVNDSDKAVMIIPSKSPLTVRKQEVDFTGNCVISFDMKNMKSDVPFSVGFAPAGKAVCELIKIENSKLMTYDGVKIRNINNEAIISIGVVIMDGKYFDVYFDGSCIVSKKRMPTVPSAKGDVIFQRQQSDEEIYLDNVRIYYSDDVKAVLPSKEYNAEKFDAVNFENDTGDYLYFDSTNLDNNKGAYINFTAVPGNGNKIVCERYDYKNPQREHNWIYIEKNTYDTCYMDISMQRGVFSRDNSENGSERQYSYYLYEADFKFDEFTYQIYMPQIRDTVSNASEVTQLPMVVGNNGYLQFSDGTVIGGLIKKGVWYNEKLYIDYISNTIKVYIDDKLIKTLDITENLKFPARFRIIMSANSNKGKLYLDNVKFTGMVNPCNDLKPDKTDIFTDEAAEREFLKGKIGFDRYSHIMYANDTKYILDKKPIFENEELFVDIDSVNTAFGTDFSVSEDGRLVSGTDEILTQREIKNKNGYYYLPVMEIGTNICKKHLFYHDKTGIILFGDKPISMNTKGWEYKAQTNLTKFTVLNDIDSISNILTFERPDKEQLAADIIAKSGDMNAHPRLLVDKNKIDELKELIKTDETAKALYEKIITAADNTLNTDVITYKYADNLRTKQYADQGIVNLLYRGVAWQLTGDRKYLEKQWQDTLSIANFPDYNVATIHDSAEWNAMLALGYDWFYDGLTKEQRDFIADRILTHSLPPLADGYYGRLRGRYDSGDWANFKWVSNMASVSNAGALMAAAAIAEYDPEYCMDIIEKAIMGLEYPLLYFAPDGSWNEGSGYWGYACLYLGYAMLTLKYTFGSTYGLEDAIGFRDTDSAMMTITGPRGVNNVGDANGGDSTKSYQAYNMIGQIIGKPGLQNVRAAHVLHGGGLEFAEDIFAYTVFDSDNDKQNGKHHSTLTGNEYFTIREDHDPESKGMFFSTHFGPTSGYHTHNDTGTFVLDLLGERWAFDLGTDDYGLQNFMGYKESDLYRYRAEGHNCLVIDPSTKFEQEQNKFVPLGRYDSNDYGGYITADLSDIYAGADKVKLGYYFDDNLKSAAVAYEISLKKESELYWFMHTDADIVVDGNNAYLMKKGKTLMLSLETDTDNAELIAMSAAPLPSSPKAPEQNQNAGYRKLALKIKGSGDVNFKIKIAPLGYGISMNMPKGSIDSWTLPEKKELRGVDPKDCKVDIIYNGAVLNSSSLPVYGGEMPKLEYRSSNANLRMEISEAKTPDEETIIKLYDGDILVNMYVISYYRLEKTTLENEIVIIGVDTSSEPQPQNGKRNMLDGKHDTRWTGMAYGEYAVFDLGSIYELDKTAVAFWKQAERRYYFDILVSEDGNEYESVFSGESEKLPDDNGFTYVDMKGKKARYIKLVGNGNSVGGASAVNINVLEFRAFKK